MVEIQQLETWVRQSIQVAERAREKGNHPFGAVLVLDGKVVLEAENEVNTGNDSTRHAETRLVIEAAQKLGRDRLKRARLIASTEPCVMCAGAIYWSGIRSVVYGCPAESLGSLAGGDLVFPCREVFHRCKESMDVVGPILSLEAIAVHQNYWAKA